MKEYLLEHHIKRVRLDSDEGEIFNKIIESDISLVSMNKMINDYMNEYNIVGESNDVLTEEVLSLEEGLSKVEYPDYHHTVRGNYIIIEWCEIWEKEKDESIWLIRWEAGTLF